MFKIQILYKHDTIMFKISKYVMTFSSNYSDFNAYVLHYTSVGKRRQKIMNHHTFEQRIK